VPRSDVTLGAGWHRWVGEPTVLQNLGINLDKIILALIKDSIFNKLVKLLNQVLWANQEAESLKAL
jgi:hypothetical protein